MTSRTVFTCGADDGSGAAIAVIGFRPCVGRIAIGVAVGLDVGNRLGLRLKISVGERCRIGCLALLRTSGLLRHRACGVNRLGNNRFAHSAGMRCRAGAVIISPGIRDLIRICEGMLDVYFCFAVIVGPDRVALIACEVSSSALVSETAREDARRTASELIREINTDSGICVKCTVDGDGGVRGQVNVPYLGCRTACHRIAADNWASRNVEIISINGDPIIPGDRPACHGEAVICEHNTERSMVVGNGSAGHGKDAARRSIYRSPAR